MRGLHQLLVAGAGALCVVLASLIHIPLVVANQSDNARALSAVRQRIEALRKDIEKTQTLHDSARTELRDIERQISTLYVSLRQIDKKLGVQKHKLQQLQQQRHSLKADLATQHHLLARQIEAAYMIGREEYMKMLLNQQDPAAVGRTLIYYDYFDRARAKRIAVTNATLKKLQVVEQDISVQTGKLNVTRQQQLDKQIALKKRSSERALVVAKLQKQLVSKAQKLKGLIADERRLQNLVTQLGQAIPDILTAPGSHKPFYRLRGQLIWPTRGKLQAAFGTRRADSRLKWHGVLIRAREGRNVRAISHGRVAYADWLRGYGLLMIIDHGDGYMSLYAHNQALYKETGEWVEAGDVIASVGKSGGESQAGLYFEIRHNGTPVNPARWCRGRPTLARYRAGVPGQELR